MKICKSCLLEKQREEFYKHNATADGLHPYCKSCTSIKSKERYQKNKNKVIKKSREYYLANKDKAYIYQCEYRKLNKDQISKRHKSWSLKNKEKIAASSKKWYSNNTDKFSVYARNRRARKVIADGSHSKNDVIFIFNSQHGLCANCATRLFKSGKKKYHVDHIMPLALDGSNDKYNLQCLCPSCNLKKHAKDPIKWANENGRLL